VAHSHQGLKQIPLSEIFFFQADQKYITVHHLQGDLLILDTLKNIETEFTEYFVRIHRNTLVNLHYIDSLAKDQTGRYTLKLQGIDHSFVVSRRQLPHLRNRMQ